MQSIYYQSYSRTLTELMAVHGTEKAMDLIVGGQYETIGILEASLLRTLGLQPGDTVVDVGCGTGRLAWALRDYLKGRYAGYDIIPSFLPYAKSRTGRDDWTFGEIDSNTIPEADGQADYVCFFSVFTHVLDEDIYRFLKEAKRLVKPSGKIVFTFLDYAVAWHWPVFESTVADGNPNRILNRFLSRETIAHFSRHLKLKVESLHDGPDAWIQLTQPITYEDGRRAEGITYFGQSVCVMSVK